MVVEIYVCSTWSQFSTFVWHSWCSNILKYLTFFTVGPRNHMAGTLENWYWPLTTRSCRPSGICVRGWRKNDVAVKHCSVDMALNSWNDPWENFTHKYVDLLRSPVRPRSRSDLGMWDLHYGQGGRWEGGLASQALLFIIILWGCCCCCNEAIWLLKTETMEAPKIEVIEYIYIYIWK